MDVARGAQLGPYVVDARIGSGGMGDVWRARDPRIGRTVAIKVLPAEVRADEDRLRRFEQEARAVGALSHPNLLVLFDVGHDDGVAYLVTELLDGESLRTRLAGGALPARTAVRIAADVARGLAAAHGAGIVHRDVKPDNLFITADGRVKILDFGVAKLRRDPSDPDGADAGVRTVTSAPETQAGAVIGTPGYMAPEQLAGRAVDARTDLFALGVVLHEMLTGRRPFAADTPIEEQAAILRAAPEPMAGVPAAIERVVLRCLEKRPEARFQSASDLAFALDALVGVDTPRPDRRSGSQPSILAGLAAGTQPSTIGGPDREPFRWIIALVWAAAGAALALALALVVWLVRAPAPPTAPGAAADRGGPRFPALDRGGPVWRRVSYVPGLAWPAKFTPDGRAVIYSWKVGTAPHHILRSELARPSQVDLGIDGLLSGVSRDGELAFTTQGADGRSTVARVFPGAGGPRDVAVGMSSPSWAPDGTMAAIRRGARGSEIEYPIGTVIARPIGGVATHVEVSRDGLYVAAIVHVAQSEARGWIEIYDRKGVRVGKSPLHDGINGVAWSPDGSEVWFSTWTGVAEANGLFAFGLDGRQRLLLHTFGVVSLQDVAADGRILVNRDDLRMRMFELRHGAAPRDRSWFDGSMVTSMSRDGLAIAFVESMGTGETSEGDLAYVRRGDATPVPIGHARDLALLPDASAVIAATRETSPLVRIPVGPGAATPLPWGDVRRIDLDDSFSISWDGRWLVFRGADARDVMRLWLLDLRGGDPRAIGPDAADAEAHPISPDGALVAIPDAAGGLRLIRTDGGADRALPGPPGERPVAFSRDGRAVLVVDGDDFPHPVVKVDVATGARTAWSTLTAPDLADSAFLGVAADADGDLAYTVYTPQADLFVVEPPPAERAPGSGLRAPGP